jgi:hypothetical protein
MKKLLLILLAIVPFYVCGQNINDVFNISATYYQGTAKSAAMGNAMGAVGDDFSSISINPAGLGLFRKTTFVFTPSLLTSYTKSKYYGDIASDSKVRLSVNNVGLVGTNRSYGAQVNWAIGMNRTNNFNNRIYVDGLNPNNSLLDAFFVEMRENNIYNDNLLEQYSPSYIFPIWSTWLFDFNNDGFSTLVPEGNLRQLKGVNSWGGTNEWTASSSINFNDKIYLGMSINISNVNNRKLTEYKEEFQIEREKLSWMQKEELSTTGGGINYKVGFIVFPASWIRLGASFHSRTIYDLTDSWRTETESWEALFTTPTSHFYYSMLTPWKLGGSAAFIFGNFGMLSVDYEYIDYSSIRLSSVDYDYGSYNDMIKSTFKPSMNVRLGTEWRYLNMCFRGGYSFYGSPYGIKPLDGYYNYHNRNSISCGFGYTQHPFTIDLAYVYTFQKQEYNLYSQYTNYYDALSPNVVYENFNAHSLVATLKLRLY